jgi:hypothetical protein
MRLLSIVFLSLLPIYALEPPAGWVGIPVGSAVHYSPRDLQPGEVVQVAAYARASLGGASLETWLKRVAEPDAPAEGKWAGALTVQRQTANIVTATRGWRDGNGKQGAAIYTAVSVDGLEGRLARVLMNDSPAMTRHRNTVTSFVARFSTEEMAAARREQRPMNIEAQPPAVANIKAGGPLVPGRYVGNVASAGKVLRRVDLQLFANGEYEFVEGARGSKGKYMYTPATGKLNTNDPCYNSTYNPDTDFCLFGRNARGEYVIYAEDYYGVGTFKTLLTRVGDVDRLPPSEAKAKAEAERAEARRYKWVTAPGKGLAAREVEAIVYRWTQVYEIGGLQMHDYSYLLLKDGTAHQGVPVPPEDMDVGASKRNEPKTWGRWRKNGGTYEFAWAEAPEQFGALQNARVVVAAGADARLAGEWKGASSFNLPGGGGAWSNWGVIFTREGRFERYRSGGAGSGMAGELSGSGVTTGVVYNDEGAVSAVVGPNVGGGSTSKSGRTKADRSGTYSLNGYTLELRYDNGAVSRLPFFFSSQDGKMLWFEGSMLMRK